MRRVIDVNLIGTLLAIQACSQRMLTAGTKGSIITIGSIASKVPDAGPFAYVLSKSAVWMLTKKAARMLAPAGIRVNSIGPGFIETNMTAVIELAPEGGAPAGHRRHPARPQGHAGRHRQRCPLPRERRVVVLHGRDAPPRRRLLHGLTGLGGTTVAPRRAAMSRR